jgi:hypothetical protein
VSIYAFFGHLSSPLCLGSSSCFFWPTLLSSLLPMMKLSNSRNYLEHDELMIKNLWGTWHHYQPSLLCFSICSLFLYMLTVFMMPLCSKLLIKWWLTCFWGLYHHYYYYYLFCDIWQQLLPTQKQWAYICFFSHLSSPLCLWSSSYFFWPTLLSSPLFCQWWNCPTLEIIWNMMS